MSVILILILASLATALLFLGGFIWAVRSGQFEDTLTPSMRVLMDEDRATKPTRSANTALPLTLTLSRREREQQSPTLRSSDVSPAISDSQNLQVRRTTLPLPAGEGRGEISPEHSRLESLNRSSRRKSALTFPQAQMERTDVRCYEVHGEGKPREFKTSGVPPVPGHTQR